MKSCSRLEGGREGSQQVRTGDNYARSTRVHTNGNVGKHFKKPKRNSQLVATNATYVSRKREEEREREVRDLSEPALKKLTRKPLQLQGREVCAASRYPLKDFNF